MGLGVSGSLALGERRGGAVPGVAQMHRRHQDEYLLAAMRTGRDHPSRGPSQRRLEAGLRVLRFRGDERAETGFSRRAAALDKMEGIVLQVLLRGPSLRPRGAGIELFGLSGSRHLPENPVPGEIRQGLRMSESEIASCAPLRAKRGEGGTRPLSLSKG